MGRMQRTKGQAGEREAAAQIRDHTGWDVSRRVRNAAGDSDLVGVPGWSVEIKRYATAARSDIAAWWMQCVSQAGGKLPVLFYRLDRADWRSVWPAAVNLRIQHADQWHHYEWTVEGSIAVWAAIAREIHIAEKSEGDHVW